MTIDTLTTPVGKTAMLLGSGELGKEVAIELMRLGVTVVACDRYEGAPAMQVANRSYVFNMLDAAALREHVLMIKPDIIIPEVEAIATAELLKLEKDGFYVVPSARAVNLTMNREGIRRLAAEELGLPTSPYMFASGHDEFIKAVETIGIPCVVKPVMSSSGHGQSTIKSEADIEAAWRESQEGGRAGAGKVIVEGFVNFDYEITMLTVRTLHGTRFCEPVGHEQVDGDYRTSWQPQPMTTAALCKAHEIARKITDALGGCGIFGVELFVKGDEVIFSEVSPRPHDTGMVTMISQDQSEFALHARALLGLPVPEINFYGPSASKALVAWGNTRKFDILGIAEALGEPSTQVRIFGKPEIRGHRRLGVVLASDKNVDEAVAKAGRALAKISVKITDDSEK